MVVTTGPYTHVQSPEKNRRLCHVARVLSLSLPRDPEPEEPPDFLRSRNLITDEVEPSRIQSTRLESGRAESSRANARKREPPPESGQRALVTREERRLRSFIGILQVVRQVWPAFVMEVTPSESDRGAPYLFV